MFDVLTNKDERIISDSFSLSLKQTEVSKLLLTVGISHAMIYLLLSLLYFQGVIHER